MSHPLSSPRTDGARSSLHVRPGSRDGVVSASEANDRGTFFRSGRGDAMAYLIEITDEAAASPAIAIETSPSAAAATTPATTATVVGAFSSR